MKKIKAMLAGIAILAVVGGVFAFKAKSAFGTNVYYTTSTLAKGCYSTIDNFTTAAALPVATTLQFRTYTTPVYYSFAYTSTCALTKAYLSVLE